MGRTASLGQCGVTRQKGSYSSPGTETKFAELCNGRGGKRSGSGIQYCLDKTQTLGQNLCKLHTGTRNMVHISNLVV